MKKNIIVFLILFPFFLLTAKEKVLNISVSSLSLTLNPFHAYSTSEAQYLTGIYEGLVSYDPKDLSPRPALAKSWRLSPDKKTYTFFIRENAKFSNGDKITAMTFRDTFLKLLAPETEAEFASLLDIISNAKEYRVGEITDKNLVGIKTEGENTLIITLKKRAPYFTKILCHHSFTPIHSSHINKKDWNYKVQILTRA